MRALYPEIDNNFDSFLQTDSIHQVYYEECGNPDGIPVIFLHGGPGSGCNETHRRYFDPNHYRIVLMDQRGCNRSTPQGCVDNNATQDILADIEAIRNRLNIKQWLLFGGSWGATLALLYAQHYPQAVSGMILRGSFLAREQDLNWFIAGVTNIFPDYWQDLTSHYPNTNIISALCEDIFSDNKQRQLKAAKAWGLWAGRIVTSSITSEYALAIEDEEKLINETRIEMHFAKHRYFIAENQIMDHISSIPEIPIDIIHGRRDLTCLPDSSYALQQSLNHSTLTILPETGHLGSETAMIDALIKASDAMAQILL